MPFFVDPAKAVQLNLREAPNPGTIIVTLAAGTEVEKIDEHATQPEWWLVDAKVSGAKVRGFLNSQFLKQGVSPVPGPAMSGNFPKKSHLRLTGKTRAMDGGRAFPLDEPNMPKRTARTAAELVTIINYLKPDKASHMRYQAGGGKTFCNIYAYDYAMRCGVFLPRVWWTDKALSEIAKGNTPAVAYETTVRELTANMLTDWFIDYGANFGWKRVFDATKLQDAANSGAVAIIVAKRTNLSKSGHILAVVPEHGGITAARDGDDVTRPVQSQAGASNFTAKVTSTRWWLGSQFQSFGFWTHA